MKKTRIVICEDSSAEKMFYAKYSREIARENGLDIEIKTYGSGNEMLFDFASRNLLPTIDIIFLDINMEGLNGIRTAEKLRKTGFRGVIVFVTASPRHYEQAFDLRAFSYVTKGENSALRFKKVFLAAVREALEIQQEYIVLSGGGEYKQVALSDIRYFEVYRKITTVYYGDKEKFEFICPLDKLENQLMSRDFFRVQRSYLVSLRHIEKISYVGITLSDGTELPVSRNQYAALKETMENLSLQ